ncbi:MAG: threonine ammonia-lyase IlvA, partial [Actinomycetes bacterium]|nr:threonine ammonia-lyase IlvA [Actinomycetes bacterium]MDX5400585.1 threonine ammonia-lyase IlvA [Actinomycetes bacterium]MDX5451028.1 threonine ammonia-lyase IlvA [Actinomycetes bacterium]
LIAQLGPEEREAGVLCASAGNHGQGVALACATLGIRGWIYVPTTTPRQKRARIQDIGGRWVEQVITGAVFDETSASAQAFAAETGAVYVPPFDHSRIVAGQGTVAWEITHQLSGPIDTVLVPVGGGGLIAGVAVWLKHLFPSLHVVGVEPEGAASLKAALAAGRPVELARIDGFVDGAAVRRVGDVPFAVVKDLVDEVVAVPEGAVCSEMLDLYQTDGIIAEPAGALASAALRGYLPRTPEGPVVCIVSGGNNDVSRYADILERSLVHEGLRHYFLVTFPQQPGALRHFLEDVLGPEDDIVLFEYVKKNNRETGPALVGIDLARADALADLLAKMDASPLAIDKLAPDSPVFEFLL